jgi:transposase
MSFVLNPTLLEFAAHYRFEPRPVAVARGSEKGRVERAIPYLRDNFFMARAWVDLAGLNKQGLDSCEGKLRTDFALNTERNPCLLNIDNNQAICSN